MSGQGPSAGTSRWRRVALASALVLLAGGAPASAATSQYPDLETLPPRDLRFSTASIGGTTHRVLLFSNTVVNRGEGRLDMVGTIDPTTLNGPAVQRVYDTAGNYEEHRVGDFSWHEAHQHFHFVNWSSYELWTSADYDAWVASGRARGFAQKVGTKTTSCILDEEFVQELPGTPVDRVYGASGCSLQPDNTLHEGLSVGWADTYDYYRTEQWIDLDQTALADGTYVLRSVADPTNALYESSGRSDAAREGQLDNEATTRFTVSGGVIADGTAPTGSITLNNRAAVTTSTNVTVSALGRDDVSGVDSFRLSDNGTAWKSFAYTPNSSSTTNVTWSLSDPAYGGTTATGTRTVYAQFHDRAGRWGPTTTDTIVLSTGEPPPPPPTTGYAGTVASDSPVAYWRLGEASGTSAADAVGTHTGAYTGGAQLGRASLVPTETNTSVGFPSTAAVRVPDAPDLQVGAPLSLEAWIRPTSLPAAGSWASVVTKAESWSLQFNGPQLELTVIQNGSRKRVKAPSGTIVAGRTYHVVGTYDGTTQRLYVNGNQVATAALTGAATPTSNQVVIGSWNGTSEMFDGGIDDVAVYGRALSATRVQAHLDAGTGGPAPTTQQVSVTVNGPGTVSSSPSGIACPVACTAAFPSGSTVTLTAAPASGATFTGWTSGACSGTSLTCTFDAYAATSATATFAGATSSTYAATVAADGPVGWWRLGEPSGTTAADVTGLHPGSYLNGVLLGQPGLLAADANTGVGLDGVNDSVRVPSAADLQLSGGLTLEAWIRPTALPAAGSWASVLTKAESWSLQFAGPQLELTVVQGGVRKRLRAPAGAVVAGGTYHVVGTYDGTTQRLYVNGSQVASTALAGSASTSTSPVMLGAWSNSSEFLSGRLDEAAVYAGALPASRVAAHWSAGRA